MRSTRRQCGGAGAASQARQRQPDRDGQRGDVEQDRAGQRRARDRRGHGQAHAVARANLQGRARRQHDQRERGIGVIEPALALHEERDQRAQRGQRRHGQDGLGGGAPGQRKQQRGKGDPEHYPRIGEERQRRLAHREIGERDRRQDIVEIGGEFQVGERAVADHEAPAPR